MLRRLPVPDLYIDIFQKVKSLGYNMVSFYVDWALLEGKPGVYREEGVFDLQPFYDAAQEAGVYLLARPGPYINAEVSGGGFPGWLQRINGTLRTRAPDYLNATDKYVFHFWSIEFVLRHAQLHEKHRRKPMEDQSFSSSPRTSTHRQRKPLHLSPIRCTWSISMVNFEVQVSSYLSLATMLRRRAIMLPEHQQLLISMGMTDTR
jgi:hypothetical protein